MQPCDNYGMSKNGKYCFHHITFFHDVVFYRTIYWLLWKDFSNYILILPRWWVSSNSLLTRSSERNTTHKFPSAMPHSVTWRNVTWQKIEENLFRMIFPCWKWQSCVLSLRLFHHAVLGCEGYLFTTKLYTFRNYDSGLKKNTLYCFIIRPYQVDLKCDINSTSSLIRPFPKPAKIDFVMIL